MLEETPIDDPLDLIVRFGRSGNFPRDRAGIQSLAQGLAKASKDTGIEMADIVERCAEQSEYCPTDHDLLQVAKEIKIQRANDAESKRNREAEWRRDYGAPRTYDWMAEAKKILPETKLHWERDRKMHALMKSQLPGRPFHKVPYPEWFKLQIWAQGQVGIPVSPEQQKELRRVSE